jgi:hypothetical protein
MREHLSRTIELGEQWPAQPRRQRVQHRPLLGDRLRAPRPALREQALQIGHPALTQGRGAQVHDQPGQRDVAIARVLLVQAERVELIEELARRTRPERLAADA